MTNTVQYFCLSLFLMGLVGMVKVPQSPRSEAAIEQVAPLLQRDLRGRGLDYGNPIFIRIFKASRELEVWVEQGETGLFVHFRTYPICAYSGTLGSKQREGDGQAPEGFYSVAAKQLNPNSQFHLAFNLGFPNAYDKAQGYTGSYLMVHGDCVSIGCYAMTDAKIEEIYALMSAALTKGQKNISVHIFPFHLKDENLNEYVTSEWFNFWRNLQEGYIYFEKYHLPPTVWVEKGRYVFK